MTLTLTTPVVPEGTVIPSTPPVGDRPRDENGRFTRVIAERPPNIRQLWKFAQSFCETLKPSEEQVGKFYMDRGNFLPTVEQLREVQSFVRRYNQTAGLFDRRRLARMRDSDEANRVINIVTNFYRSYNDITGRLNNLPSDASFRLLRDASQRMRAVRPVNVFNDLLAICRMFPTVYVRDSKSLKLTTPPIVLQSPTNRTIRYEFGQFRILLKPDYGRGFKVDGPDLIACTPRYARQHDSVTHPHVNQGKICAGSGAQAASKAYDEGRLFDVVDIMHQVLQNYGNNPFARITEWNGVCDVRFNPATGEPISHDALIDLGIEIIMCRACGAEVDTVHNCIYCSRSSCGGCVIPCGERNCTNRYCHGHWITCDDCGRHFCRVRDNITHPTGIRSVSHHFTLSTSRCDTCHRSRSGLPPVEFVMPGTEPPTPSESVSLGMSGHINLINAGTTLMTSGILDEVDDEPFYDDESSDTEDDFSDDEDEDEDE